MANESFGLGIILSLRDKLTGKSKKPKKAMEEIEDAAKKGTKSVNKLSSGITALSGTLSAAAGARVINGIQDSYGKLQTGLTRIFTLLPNASEEQKKIIEKTVKDAIAAGSDVAVASDAAFKVISAGYTDLDEFQSVFQTSLRASIGGFTEQNIVVDALSKTMAAYSQTGKEAQLVMDRIGFAADFANTNVGALADALPQASGTAAMGGVSQNEFIGATAILSNQLKSSSVAANSFRQGILAIQKPTGDAEKIIKKFGLRLFSAKALKTNGLIPVLAELQEKIGDDSDALGKLFASSEAQAAIFPLITSLAGQYSNILDGLEASAGNTDQKFKEVNKTFEQTKKRMAGQLFLIQANIGEPLIKAFEPIFAKLEEWSAKFGVFLQENEGFAKGIGIAIVAFTAFAAIIGVVAAGLFVFTSAAALVVIKVVAIGAAIAALGYALWQVLKIFGYMIADIIIGFSNLGSDLKRDFGKLVVWMGGVFESIGNAIAPYLQPIADAFTNIWESVKNITTIALETIKLAVSNVFSGIKSIIKSGFSLLSKLPVVGNLFEDSENLQVQQATQAISAVTSRTTPENSAKRLAEIANESKATGMSINDILKAQSAPVTVNMKPADIYLDHQKIGKVMLDQQRISAARGGA